MFDLEAPASGNVAGLLPAPVTAAPGLPPPPQGAPPVSLANDPAPPPPAPVLKPAGRVSIPVSFPLDGTVHRFRKINDHAALTLALKAPVQGSFSSRWLATGLLAAGLGILWLVNRKTRRRV